MTNTGNTDRRDYKEITARELNRRKTYSEKTRIENELTDRFSTESSLLIEKFESNCMVWYYKCAQVEYNKYKNYVKQQLKERKKTLETLKSLREQLEQLEQLDQVRSEQMMPSVDPVEAGLRLVIHLTNPEVTDQIEARSPHLQAAIKNKEEQLEQDTEKLVQEKKKFLERSRTKEASETPVYEFKCLKHAALENLKLYDEQLPANRRGELKERYELLKLYSSMDRLAGESINNDRSELEIYVTQYLQDVTQYLQKSTVGSAAKYLQSWGLESEYLQSWVNPEYNIRDHLVLNPDIIPYLQKRNVGDIEDVDSENDVDNHHALDSQSIDEIGPLGIRLTGFQGD